MSKVGQWRVSLQEMPEYSMGADAYGRGEPKALGLIGLAGNALTAYGLGYDDARDDANRPYEE